MSKFEIFQAATSIVQVVATLLIAAIVYTQAQKLKRAEITGQILERYNILNSVALQNDANLRIFDSLGRNNTNDRDETRRKRWCGFIWLVALQNVFTAGQDGMIAKAYSEKSLQQQLGIILKDDLIFWLVMNRGFDPNFAQYCTNIRKEVAPNKPLEYSEEEAIRGLG